MVAEAEDGRRCIELCLSLRPDVVTLDMMMPVLSGLAATEYIMAYCPTPIVIVSASLNRGEVYTTYQALAAGAVEVIEKPGPSGSGPAEPGAAWDQRLIATVKLVSRVKVITHPRGRLGAGGDHRPQAGVGLGPALLRCHRPDPHRAGPAGQGHPGGDCPGLHDGAQVKRSRRVHRPEQACNGDPWITTSRTVRLPGSVAKTRGVVELPVMRPRGRAPAGGAPRGASG